MTEAEALVARAHKYLRSAELLLSANDYESVVSRAYYAMFYVAEAALLSRGISASSHKGVIAALGEHFIKTGVFPKELARQFAVAFQKRQLGDYEYTPVIAREEAVEILASARDFVRTIESWLADSTTTGCGSA
jgi:uncharacterized protein (UPF0332 family)